jgi:hypothetical protein
MSLSMDVGMALKAAVDAVGQMPGEQVPTPFSQSV